jgi:hypothetical protein
MSFGNKLFESIGDKSRDVSEKLAQKYREHLGEELIKKEEELKTLESKLEAREIKKEEEIKMLESKLEARERAVSEREGNLNKYYSVPRRYIDIPIVLSIIVAAYLAYNSYETEIKNVVSNFGSKSVQAPVKQSNTKPVPDSYSGCVRNGIAYYKEIGSYPTLSNGEDANRKVKGMCSRSGGMAFSR